MPSLSPGRACPPLIGRKLDQEADAVDVDAAEGVGRVDALLDIGLQELRAVVAGEAERHLGQIVGAEAEELRCFGDLACLESAARGTSIMVPVW